MWKTGSSLFPGNAMEVTNQGEQQKIGPCSGSQVLTETTLWVRNFCTAQGHFQPAAFSAIFWFTLSAGHSVNECSCAGVEWSMGVAHILREKKAKGKKKPAEGSVLKTFSVIYLNYLTNPFNMKTFHCHKTVDINEKNRLCFQVAACEWCENIFCDKCS